MKIKEIVSALERFAPLPLQDGLGAGVTVGMNPFNLSNTFCLNDVQAKRIAKVKRIHSHGNTST